MTLEKIMNALDFPEEAVEYFRLLYARIGEREELDRALNESARIFFETDSDAYRELNEGIARELDVPRYTVDMLMLLLVTEPLERLYRERGISREIALDTMRDLRIKLVECKSMYGCWGTFVAWWFRYHAKLRLFTLGRLQFEPIAFPYDGYKDLIKKGETVYNCHIPSGAPLAVPEVIDAFKRAYSFFGAREDGLLPIYCSSWLLYPPTASLYPDGSNLKRFYELYDIIHQRTDERFSNFWRVFALPYSEEALKTAPEDNSLRRAFKKYLLKGGRLGDGQGVIIFDGDKILN